MKSFFVVADVKERLCLQNNKYIKWGDTFQMKSSILALSQYYGESLL